MFTTRVVVSFDAGHRLLGYPGKCASPHGHSFTAEIFVASPGLGPTGLVIDFGDVKTPMKRWIDEHWDHGFLLNDQDVDMIRALQMIPEAKIALFFQVNPSAENMARELYLAARHYVGDVIEKVRIWESTTQYAEYRPEPSPSC